MDDVRFLRERGYSSWQAMAACRTTKSRIGALDKRPSMPFLRAPPGSRVGGSNAWSSREIVCAAAAGVFREFHPNNNGPNAMTDDDEEEEEAEAEATKMMMRRRRRRQR